MEEKKSYEPLPQTELLPPNTRVCLPLYSELPPSQWRTVGEINEGFRRQQEEFERDLLYNKATKRRC